MIALTLLFLMCAGLVAYVYVGYPVLLLLAGAIRARPSRARPITPRVSVIIAAHNEEQIIREKLDNSAALDYPRDRLEIVVACDGCTDRTAAIARGYGDPRVTVMTLPRCGKAAALSHAAAEASGEVLVFTDANAVLEPGALYHLVGHFADPEVGGVCGDQRYWTHGRGGAAAGENLYWTYDKWLKRLESRTGGTIAADGSIYAIRRPLFVAPPDGAQADDFAISAAVALQGYRLIFESAAVAYEPAPASEAREFSRKVRVANHGIRAILNVRQALNPFRYGAYAFKLLSHKCLRCIIPFCVPIAFAANLPLASHSTVFLVTLVGQTLFYGGALLGYVLRGRSWGRMPFFYGPFFFCLAHAALLCGVLSVLRGQRIAVWTPERGTTAHGHIGPVGTSWRSATRSSDRRCGRDGER